MDKCPPSIPMSQIIASDAPLLSPVSPMDNNHWDNHLFPATDNYHYSYYHLPPSPPNSVGSAGSDSPTPSSRMLKMRMSPDNASDGEQLCLPTHQLFDFPEAAHPLTPSSPSPSSPDDLPSVVKNESTEPSSSLKRSASPASNLTKKRVIGERISSKDFVPPDVSGLSKREARLVKNRAAAFLSRQRKREEFECMEVRVSELEQENARLLALTRNGNIDQQQSHSDTEFVSEIEQLRAQLAAAKERELELSAKLASKPLTRDAPIKVEASDPMFPLSSPQRTTTIPSSHKSGASLGLMVLLCALPTLLSMPVHSTAPTSFSLPTPFPASASAYDFNSYLPNDYDWSRNSGSSMMDLDAEGQTMVRHSTTRKLEFTDVDAGEFGGLGGLDISFDASPADNGKIRVRIHPHSSASSRAGSPTTSSFVNMKSPMSPSSSSLGMWSGSESSSMSQASFSSPHAYGSSFSTSQHNNEDPFLGIGASHDFGIPYPSSHSYGQSAALSALDYGQMSDSNFDLASEYSIPDGTTGGKRRVRIALKSMPTAGGEGGEWEVQFC